MALSRRPAGLLAVWTLLVAATGCGPRQPARLVAPAFSPEQAATLILARADANADGSIDPGEAAKVPALKTAVRDLDGDGDKRLSREELLRWLEEIQQARVAINPLGLTVTHRGKPLANAKVRLVPDDFLGPGVQPATGTTDSSGLVRPAIADSPHAGVNCGLYRIEISGQGNDGRALPARFNTATALGLAVGGPIPRSGVVTIALD
jgi:hypothetical protein